MPDLLVARRFLSALFGHQLLQGLYFGTSAFPPKRGRHAWHDSPDAAADWGIANAGASNIYFRTTPVREPPAKGRADAKAAAAIVGFHADIDIADPAHKKTILPPDLESAQRVIERIGLKPTITVHSGHGLQPHFLLKEPWVFENGDGDRAAAIAARFGQTVGAAAGRLGFGVDNVSDLARILRLPGTLNRKAGPVAVTIRDAGGPRYTLDDIEAVLVDKAVHQPESVVDEGAESGTAAAAATGFPGTDDELLDAARRSKQGTQFRALFDAGDTSTFGGDHSKADWHLADRLAFWCGRNTGRIDLLFRRSKLMRPKWDERHAGDGSTYGQMTVGDVLSKRTTFFRPRPRLPLVFVGPRQLRDQTADALAALERVNTPPTVFQRGTDIVRVRTDEATGRPSIECVGTDEMIGLLTRSADYVVMDDNRPVPVSPPQIVARDILALPAWRFPPLVAIVESPRMRPDGSVLLRPGYDSARRLWLTEYAGHESFDVPHDPDNQEVSAAVALIDDLLCDFPFEGAADRANAIGFMLTPIVRPAIKGSVPLAAFDARSKQGSGKGLLVRTGLVVGTGRDPSMTAIPGDEAEWRKSITASLAAGREVVVYDNATGGLIESGIFANVLTADMFDDRILGVSKRGEFPVRCTWAITGNGMIFGGDMVRRTYLVMLDAGVERPEDRTGFRHELPAYALENRPALLRACLILCRRWWSDGCPTPRVAPWGSYEEFVRIVGGILEHAGIKGFLDNRATFRQAADVERAEWFAFVTALARRFPDGLSFVTAEVVAAAKSDPDLVEALPVPLREAWDREKAFSSRLGKAFRKHAGAIFNRYRLVDAGRNSHSKQPMFAVVEAQVAGGAVGCGGCGSLVSREDDIPL